MVYRDDGRGLDLRRIYQKAAEKGLVNATEADMSPLDVAHLILSPGFSTKDQVSEISGRGFGMDAVAHYLKMQGGALEIILGGDDRSQPQPALFRMQWPRMKYEKSAS